jgi:hypothetical protein
VTFRERVRSALRTPPDVEAIAEAATGERLLAWARDSSGEPVIATNAGIWAYGDRLAWTEIDHVGWAEGVLSILAIDGETRRLALTEDRDLPAVVRGEVEGSVVTSRVVPLRPDGGGATIVARRDTKGELHWRVRYDPNIVPDDRARAEVDATLVALRIELGI